MGMDELVDQARLPHAGLADQRHHLAMTRPGLRQRLLEYFASHNARLYDLLGVDFGWDK